MTRLRLFPLLLGLLTLAIPVQARRSFNEDWQFHKGAAEGAEKPTFDAKNWRKVTLPHDWAIEGPFDVKFNARSGGLPFHGTGWYRKDFHVPASAAGRRIAITFDGAMYNAHVWINGHFLGNRPFGYLGFQYDLSPHLQFGKKNTIAVRLQPEDLSSRWYPGAGLYRNVWIEESDPVYFPLWATEITTPRIAIGETAADTTEAEVRLKTTARNGSKTRREVSLTIDLDGKTHPVWSGTLNPGESRDFTKTVLLSNPKFWGLWDPHLYSATFTLCEKDKALHQITERFGVRTFAFSATEGFSLNHEPIKLNGVCLHHDLGPLGAAVNISATRRQLEIMKKMGVNAIRTAHNPPSPEQLDLCDELGLLVQVEAFDCWRIPKIPNGYNKFFDEWHERDLRDMIRRDRNHPCVIMWSIGNEILEQGKKDGWKLARHLHQIVKNEDPTRPTTAGFNWYPAAIENGLAAEVDLPGFNYKPLAYQDIQKNHPDWPIYGSETSSCTSSRGVYHYPLEKYKTYSDNQVTSYDIIGPVWMYPPDIEFMAQERSPTVFGEFVWTGFDYLGEPTPYGGRDNSTNGYWNDDWPSRSSYFGAVDLAGFPKDRFYLYQSQWTVEPMAHVLPHWNWESGQTIPVYAYTNAHSGELFLNGKSLGKKIKGQDKADLIVNFKWWPGFEEGKPEPYASPYRLRWDVPFTAGELKFVAYDQSGKAVAESTRHTAGAPAQIRLTPEKATLSANSDDLAFVQVEILDQNSHLCPRADNQVHFEVSAGARLVAVGNGNAASLESFQAPHRKAFSGKCLAILRADKGRHGPITLTAKSEGLQSTTTQIEVR